MYIFVVCARVHTETKNHTKDDHTLPQQQQEAGGGEGGNNCAHNTSVLINRPVGFHTPRGVFFGGVWCCCFFGSRLSLSLVPSSLSITYYYKLVRTQNFHCHNPKFGPRRKTIGIGLSCDITHGHPFIY